MNKKGGQGLFGGSTKQPDYFWVAPRDWKNYFAPIGGLPKWDFSKSTLPPQEFAPAARAAHAFVYEESKRFFVDAEGKPLSPRCPAFPMNGGAPIQVDCEFRYPRPQPLINVVEKLVEESRK